MSKDFDLTALERATSSLREILAQPKNKFIVAGTIQNFEFTFELAWKAMQRLLKLRGVDTGSPNQVFRAAIKEGFIENFELWNEFLKKRNLTVHTYNESTAEEVYASAKAFLPVVSELLSRLKTLHP
jgi:nucleotidyltransferase substrate binding protein (TIGR01987 family)